jgi:hypothetical protein
MRVTDMRWSWVESPRARLAATLAPNITVDFLPAESPSSQPGSLVAGHSPTGAHVGEQRQARRPHGEPLACDS